MAAIDFPNSPTVGQEFNSGLTVFVWTGDFWRVKYSGTPGDSLSNETPLMNGTASAGSAVTGSRHNHVHPTDTSRAPLASPTFTGTPSAPTAAANTNTTQIATTAFVIGQGYAKLSDLGTTYQAADTDLTSIANINSGSGLLYRTDGVGYSLDATSYASLASPTFTGTPAAPTAAVDTNTTQIATTAFVIGQGYVKSSSLTSTLSSYALLSSPTFTGTPAAPTASADTNTTQIATTAYVIGQGYLKSATASTTYQPLDADLTSIAGLSGTSGYLKKTAADTWTLDTSTFLDTSSTSQTKAGDLQVANLVITGDLTVNGTQNIVDTNNLSISDSLIELANNQTTANALDIGFHGMYSLGAGMLHTGLVKDVTDSKWKLFSGAPEPVSGVVDFTSANYDILKIGALEVTSTTVVTNLNADMLDGTHASSFALLASPTFTGTPSAPTAAVDTNTTQIATTAFVIGQGYAKTSALSSYALLASPTFTGTPSAPTAAVDTNTTQIATTAYVIGQGYLKSSSYTASDVLSKLLTVDGTGSTLDSDLLDGQDGAYYTEEVVTFTRTSTAAISTGLARFQFPFAATIMGISMAAATAPTGADLIIDVNKNGSTIFTTQTNRPRITAGTNTDVEVTNMNITAFAIGDYLTIDIDQVGSTVAGSDITVMVRYRRA